MNYAEISTVLDDLKKGVEQMQRLVRLHKRSRFVEGDMVLELTGEQKQAIVTKYAEVYGQLKKDFQRLPEPTGD